MLTCQFSYNFYVIGVCITLMLTLICSLIEMQCNKTHNFQSILGSDDDCRDREPGYYADISSDCRKYLLCISSANTRGLHFNCPPGEI